MKLNKVLIIATHFDDETYGCGGTIQKFKNLGKKIYLLVISDPSGYVFNKKKLATRYSEIKKVKKFYKFDKIFELRYPASQLYKIDKTKFINDTKKIINQIKPDTIIMNHYNDAHSDHREVFQNMRYLMKPFRFNYIKNIFLMEIPSETDQGLILVKDTFKPSLFVDISKFIDLKIKALKIYKSQILNSPNSRNVETIRSLSRLRGGQSGYKFAEAFQILRGSID